VEKLQESQQEKVSDSGTYTQKLSRRIDAAYDAYKARENNSEELLYGALLAQANNIVRFRLRSDPYDRTLGCDIARRAMMSLKDFLGKSKVSTWFYQIAQREVNRSLRELIETRNNTVTLNASCPSSPDAETADPPALWEKARRQDRLSQASHTAKLDIRRLGRHLPREQARVVSLHAEGHSLKQIAKLTGEPLGTIRSRYRLAKGKMKARATKRDIPGDMKKAG
jgi:DNA-directed RNA polymerase specialized sigma24 family protein